MHSLEFKLDKAAGDDEDRGGVSGVTLCQM